MKKRVYSIYFLVLAVMLIISGCSSQPKNQIWPRNITEDEISQVEKTFGDAENALACDFQVEEEFSELQIWVDEYEFGKITNNTVFSHIVSLDKVAQGKGTILINFSDTDISNVAIVENGVVNLAVSGVLSNENYNSIIAGWLEVEQNITEKSEIILASIMYSNEETATFRAYSVEEYIGHGELLEEYPVAFLVKCSFS